MGTVHRTTNDQKILHTILWATRLWFQIGVESRASYIGSVNDLLYCDFTICFLWQEIGKSRENCRPCFLLTSIHTLAFHTNHSQYSHFCTVRICQKQFTKGKQCKSKKHHAKKMNDFLAILPMIIVTGIFVLLDLVLHLLEECDIRSLRLSFIPFDPAWVTVIICGIPLLYQAVWRIIHNPGISRISSALLITIAIFSAIVIGDLFVAGKKTGKNELP